MDFSAIINLAVGGMLVSIRLGQNGFLSIILFTFPLMCLSLQKRIVQVLSHTWARICYVNKYNYVLALANCLVQFQEFFTPSPLIQLIVAITKSITSRSK